MPPPAPPTSETATYISANRLLSNGTKGPGFMGDGYDAGAVGSDAFAAAKPPTPAPGSASVHKAAKHSAFDTPAAATHGIAIGKECCNRSGEEAWRKNLRGDGVWAGPRPAWFWTGKQPLPGVCPGVAPDGTITSLPLPNISTCSRQDVLDYFDNTWAITETLFSALQGEEAFFRPPYHELRHPLIFYYCHPAALYINKFRVAGLLTEGLNDYFEVLFETGVDEMSWDDLSKNQMDWPSVREVHAYRQQVYATVKRVIETAPGLGEPGVVTLSHPLWAVFMGFEHERIHIETSSVLMRELPQRLLVRPASWPADHPSVMAGGVSASFPPRAGQDYPTNPMLRVPTGDVLLGKPSTWPSFGWDNEYGERRFHVREFDASSMLVSNGEFHAFVRAGGYREPAFWTEDGWKWRTFRNAKWPTFWVQEGPAGLFQFRLRLVFDIVPMPWALPADVNVHEARAFAAWRSKFEAAEGLPPYRLESELEHHRLREPALHDAQGRVVTDPAMERSGVAMRTLANLNLAWGSQSAVDALPPTAAGFHDVFGNVWQWCEDYLCALPGFKIHPYYDDFSTPCFDGQHHIIMGGSFVATGDEASVFARFHFRPHFFQHAGFRLVRPVVPRGAPLPPLMTSDTDAPPPYVGKGPFRSLNERKADAHTEGRDELGAAMLHAYGSPEQTIGALAAAAFPAAALAFPARAAEMLALGASKRGLALGRVLDIGCAVGGSAFELARRGAGEVLAVDLDPAMIAAGNALRRDGSLEYYRKDEGDVGTQLTGNVAGLSAAGRSRVTFRQMDACCLAADLAPFDAVLVANVLDCVMAPRSILGRMAGPRGMVKLGGLLLVATANNWDASVTPKESWLGGSTESVGGGEPIGSREGLAVALRDGFELLEEADLPLLVREHARAFRLQIAYASLWRRVA